MRVSEVAALDVGDVQAEPDGSGRLFVGESKTDQEGRGAVLYLGALTVSRVNVWLAAAATRTGRCFAAFEGAAASNAIQGAGCRSTPSAESSAAGRPLSASRAGYPVTVSALGGRNRWQPAGRNRWQPAGPRLSRCRRRAGGSHRRCRATMHGASWQHGAPSLASATVADKAGVDGSSAAAPPRTAPAHLSRCAKITTARTPVNRQVFSLAVKNEKWSCDKRNRFGTDL